MKLRLAWIALLVCPVMACRPPEQTARALVLATTTSTQDSGLLDVLVPMFEAQTGIEVKVVAVGSGQALALARRGDADVLLTHAPTAEETFMRQGYGATRETVMYNRFLVVGPRDDPARISEAGSVGKAFARIAETASSFVSRGDNSGTHMREQEIWKQAGIAPDGAWYLEAGSGMAQTLRVASEKRAYTLCDQGTFLSHERLLDLAVLFEDDPLLLNRYSVIVVNPEKHAHLNHDGAVRFAQFLLAPATQKAIGAFGVDRYGQPLFKPR